jgi:hypothetical protein
MSPIVVAYVEVRPLSQNFGVKRRLSNFENNSSELQATLISKLFETGHHNK